MAPKVRDRIINALIYIASGITVAMVMFFTTNKKADAQQLEKKLNSKLDKIEYQNDQAKIWSAHDKIHIIESQKMEDNYKKIDWLYKNEISKNNYRIAPLKNE